MFGPQKKIVWTDREIKEAEAMQQAVRDAVLSGLLVPVDSEKPSGLSQEQWPRDLFVGKIQTGAGT